MTEAMFRALIVEDDASIQAVIATLLHSEGFRVVVAETAERGRLEARNHQPDLVIVDLGLPDQDGHWLIREIRASSTVPILVLSARTAESEKIAALDGGADDFVTKPFSAGELLARVRAARRRAIRAVPFGGALRIGQLTLDLEGRQAHGPDGPLHFTPLEYRVLQCLVGHQGLVVTQDKLLREVWGPDRSHDPRGLRTYIKLLRAKIEPDPARPRFLLTEAGLGYRLQVEG
jgi:two-component system, OmpR family, KDP operon response regulator KdpE